MKFEYGISNNIIDITDIIYNKCLKNDIIYIPSNDVTRKNLFGVDPCRGTVKLVFINGVEINHLQEIRIDLNKKICICFYGLTRSLKYTHNSIKNNILRELINHNYYFDIYMHTYDLFSITNKRSNEKNSKLDFTEYLLIKPDYILITNQILFDKTININDYLKHGDPWPENPKISLFNLLRQFNSLKLVTNLHINNNDYLTYIYLRPDLKYLNKFDINILKNFQNNTFYTPNWGKFGGLNDRLCIGDKNVIEYFSYKRFDDAKEYSNNKKLHSETYLKDIMKNFNIININLKANRIRSTGEERKDCS